MKSILMAAAAVVFLSGAAVTNEARADQRTGVSVSGKKVVHSKHKYRSRIRSDGYSTLPPKRDYGRYSNLPGKDALNSKAYIQDR